MPGVNDSAALESSRNVRQPQLPNEWVKNAEVIEPDDDQRVFSHSVFH